MTSGATWLLERQGSEGEWGEAEMFPDLDQVRILLKSNVPQNNLSSKFCMIPSMALLPFLSGHVHKSPKPQAPVEFQPTAVTAQVVITLASLDHQQKVSLMMVMTSIRKKT